MILLNILFVHKLFILYYLEYHKLNGEDKCVAAEKIENCEIINISL